MKFIVKGANRETGKPIEVTVEAGTEAEARDQANDLGILISEIRVEAPQQVVVTESRPPATQPPATPAPMQAAHQPQVHIAVTPKRSNSVGIVSFVLGLVALLICWVPFVSCITLPLSGVGLLLAVIGLILAITRGGYGIGWPIGGGVVCGMAFIAAMITGIGFTAAVGEGVGGMAEAIVEAENARTQTNQEIMAIEGAVEHDGHAWAPWSDPVVQGDVEVALTSARIALVELRGYNGKPVPSAEPQLIIELTVRNTSTTTRANYKPWMGADFAFGRDYASCQDEHGNVNQRISFGLTPPIDQVRASTTIDPGEELVDIIVFQPPIDAATQLFIEMPASNFGGRGMLRFLILTDEIIR